MAVPKIVHGARALIHVGPKLVGIINNISYQVSWDTQDAYILGRMGPAEIGYTGAEPVSGNMSGWRIMNNGAHVVGLPELKDLLTQDYTVITIVDRVTNLPIAKVQGVRLLGHSGGQATRQMSEIGIPFKGMAFADETTGGAEPSGSTDLSIS